MSSYELTKTKMMQGVWEGIITGSGSERPEVEATYLGKVVDDVSLTENGPAGHWVLRVPIPRDAIADGVQTILITDKRGASQIGSMTMLAGEALDGDIRAELDLLRAELDMLKRAFRRHCLETM